ncbi:MAG TPA: PAS domain-containing protein [Dongiaceae bacterium]|nr:PAS domain-containing protein [Dongiaceae bacterium]
MCPGAEFLCGFTAVLFAGFERHSPLFGCHPRCRGASSRHLTRNNNNQTGYRGRRVREVASVEELSSSIGTELYAYWERKRGSRRMPSRADIDPADLKRILPSILIAKIDRETRRVRYTLVGTRCVAQAGMDYTGHYLDEIDFTCDFDTDWHETYRTLTRDKRPIFGIVKTFLKDNRVCDLAEVLLPLSDDGETVTHCIAIEDARLGLRDVEDLMPARLALKQSA